MSKRNCARKVVRKKSEKVVARYFPTYEEIIESDCNKFGYHVTDKLGSGAFASVRKAQIMTVLDDANQQNKDLAVGDTVAVKIINKLNISTKVLEKFVPRELKNHAAVPSHKNIVRLHEVFETEDHIYLVLEYCSNGTLFDLIRDASGSNANGIDEMISKKIFKQLCSAVQHLHNAGIVHRDLKTENILFDMDMVPKLTDFGFSRTIKEADLFKTYCGSPSYTAPEVRKCQPYDGIKSDIWSLGVILFAMVNGRCPFDNLQIDEMPKTSKVPTVRFKNHLSMECMVLIRRLLQYSPQQRPSIDELLQDPWLTGNKPTPRPRWVIPVQPRTLDTNEETDSPTKETAQYKPNKSASDLSKSDKSNRRHHLQQRFELPGPSPFTSEIKDIQLKRTPSSLTDECLSRESLLKEIEISLKEVTKMLKGVEVSIKENQTMFDLKKEEIQDINMEDSYHKENSDLDGKKKKPGLLRKLFCCGYTEKKEKNKEKRSFWSRLFRRRH